MTSNTPLLDKKAVSWKTYIQWTADCFQTIQTCIVVKVWILFTLKSQIKMELFLNSYRVPLCPTSQVTWWGRRASRACLNCRRQTVTTSHPRRQRGSQSWTGTRPCWRLWCNQRTNNRWCQKLPTTCCFGWREEEREYLREVGLWIVPPLL